MKVTKEKVKVKIRTNSYIIIGYVHIIPEGRLGDFISGYANKFIPVTEAKVYPLEKKIEEDIEAKDGLEVIFINREDIEVMMYL